MLVLLMNTAGSTSSLPTYAWLLGQFRITQPDGVGKAGGALSGFNTLVQDMSVDCFMGTIKLNTLSYVHPFPTQYSFSNTLFLLGASLPLNMPHLQWRQPTRRLVRMWEGAVSCSQLPVSKLLHSQRENLRSQIFQSPVFGLLSDRQSVGLVLVLIA